MRYAPGPKKLPILGNIQTLLGDRLKNLEDLHAKYGEIVRIEAFGQVFHIIFHPDYFKHVMVTNAKSYYKGRTFEKAKAYLGNGIASSEGTLWQRQRRIMNPFFSKKSIKHFSPVIDRVIKDSIDNIIQRDNKVFDLNKHMQNLSMNILASTIFGYGVKRNEVNKIIEAIPFILKFSTDRVMLPFNIPEDLPIPSNLKYKKNINIIDDVIYSMIEGIRSSDHSGSLLSILVKAKDPETGEQMSSKQLRDEIMTLFVGGVETIANAMTWLLYNIYNNPVILEKIKSLVNSCDELDYTALDQFDFISNVINESLRLHPQNYLMSRDALSDDEIGGYHIPRGSTVFLAIHVLHRREDFWDNPLEFDPSRFQKELKDKHHRFQYAPYGAGMRKCIGTEMAHVEMLLLVIRYVSKLDLSIVGGQEIKPDPKFTCGPKGGILVKAS